MKTKVLLSLVLVICFALTACGTKKVDFTNAKDFEAALNNGDDLKGKVVTFVVEDLNPNSALGYNLLAGEHLNFVSSSNPGVKTGDTITVKVTEVQSLLGSWIIGYKIVK